jgi:hypothetical protein
MYLNSLPRLEYFLRCEEYFRMVISLSSCDNAIFLCTGWMAGS